MTQSAHIRRYSFYTDTDRRTLRFDETSPHEPAPKCICGCTCPAETRPPGTPVQVSQQALLTGEFEGMRTEVQLLATQVVFRWGAERNGPHAYFYFGPNRCQIEIFMQGYGYVDYVFAHVYLGPEVDISRLYNGHSPSKIVDLSTIAPGEVWLHGCHWGKEVKKTIPSGKEADQWRTIFELTDKIRHDALSYGDKHMPVDTLRGTLEADTPLLNLTLELQRHLAGVVKQFPGTELFRLTHEIDQETDALPHDKGV